jgi:hypothetical protein
MKKVLLTLFICSSAITLFGQSGYNYRIWAINCGYMEKEIYDGFRPDTFAIKGEALWWWGANAISTLGVVNAAPSKVYETTRFEWSAKDVEYLITGLKPSAEYLVRLHWGDLTEKIGGRVFDVVINDLPYEVGLDICALNGGVPKKALVRDYEIPSNPDGTINLLFTNVAADNACINGIEVYSKEAAGTNPTEELEDQVFIYPNPATDRLIIAGRISEISSLTIFDVQGKIVGTREVSLMENQKIDISGLAEGFYFLRIRSGKNIITKKFLKR